MGAFGDPRVPDMRHAREILLGTRFKLDLYINLRPVRCLNDRLCPLKRFEAKDIDFVVFRENTEGLYVGMGGVFKKGTADEIAIQGVNEKPRTHEQSHKLQRTPLDFDLRLERTLLVVRYAAALLQVAPYLARDEALQRG